MTKRQKRAPADARSAWRAMNSQQQHDYLEWIVELYGGYSDLTPPSYASSRISRRVKDEERGLVNMTKPYLIDCRLLARLRNLKDEDGDYIWDYRASVDIPTILGMPYQVVEHDKGDDNGK